MTIAFESGYTLPGGDLALNHARILHRGNKLKSMAISATSEVVGFEADAADAGSGLTFDYWKAFENAITEPLTFEGWTTANVTLSADNKTVTETADSGEHDLSFPYTFANTNEHIFAVRVKRQTVSEFQLAAFDGTTTYTAFFDLRDISVGTTSGTTGVIKSLGDDEYLCSIRFSPAAAAGDVEVRLSNGSETLSYTGDTSNSIRLIKSFLHESSATWDFTGWTAGEADCFCIAAHNIGTNGGRLRFYHDSNDDSTYTEIGELSPSDNSPIMFIFAPITSKDWRLIVDRCVDPQIAVIRIGKALQMERPFYGGFQPSLHRRKTGVRGNKSQGSQWLGRSIILKESDVDYKWDNLTFAWVRANLIGDDKLIKAVEREPFFLAWRSSVLNDVDYAWTAGPISGPELTGVRDLTTFSFPATVFGYD